MRLSRRYYSHWLQRAISKSISCLCQVYPSVSLPSPSAFFLRIENVYIQSVDTGIAGARMVLLMFSMHSHVGVLQAPDDVYSIVVIFIVIFLEVSIAFLQCSYARTLLFIS